jgi:hypothetical protein
MFHPSTREGKRLLAHELAHTVQQKGAGTEPPGRLNTREGEAANAANRVLSGRAIGPLTRSGLAVARDTDSDAIEVQIRYIQMQLMMPVQPMRLMLLEQLARLQAIRLPAVSHATPPPFHEPSECAIMGGAATTPENIENRLRENTVASVNLLTQVNMPGPMTYEMARPQLRELERQKVQLLRCGITLGWRTRKWATPSKDVAEANARYALEAQKQLNRVAEKLGEKQAERQEAGEGTLSDQEMIALDVHDEGVFTVGTVRRRSKWQPIYVRDKYVDDLEDEVNKNQEAEEVYKRTVWDRETNKPEKKSWFKKVTDTICEYTNPCHDNLEQFHADLESGMSRDDALARGVIRIGINAIPSKTGPGDLVIVGENQPVPIGLHPDLPAGMSDTPSVHTDPVIRTQPPEPPPGLKGGPTDVPVVHTNEPTVGAQRVPADPAPSAPKETPKPKVVADPKAAAKSEPKPKVPDKAKVMRPLPGGEHRGTVTTTPSGSKASKPANPVVEVRRTPGSYPDPQASYDPYAPQKPDISNQFRFREWETNGKTYKRASGRLGMPDEVQTHRDPSAQRRVSGGTGDDAGHLIGNRFGPPGTEENLERQNWEANRVGNYHKLEDAWAGLRKRGVEIDVQVTDVTKAGADRPFRRNVQWTETAPDGTVKNYDLDFVNTETEESRAQSGDRTDPGTSGGKLLRGNFTGDQ